MFIEIAHAASGGINPMQSYQITDIVRIIVSLVILFSGVLSVLFIIWGGVMLILSGGKDDKVKPAINSIRYAVIGIIIIIISIFAIPKVGDLLGLNVSSYISPQNIFSTIQTLSKKIFSPSSSSSVDIGNGNGTGPLPNDFSNL